jgi:catechol 2,3-dioxygenase-like lactoylglutathione lyase family enzyme
VITGIQDVYYNVTDMQRAVGFYRDVLGMRVVDSNEWWSSLDCFGARVGLHGGGGAAVPTIPQDAHGALCGATLTLRSSDLDADLDYLRRCRVDVVSRADAAWGSIAVFRDTEGNLLKLMQPAASQPQESR